MDEWLRLIQDYPTVAFNVKNFNGQWNTPDRGFRCLVQCEPFIGMQENWDVGIIRKYDCVVTWNPKFYQNYIHLLPKMVLVTGCLGCNAPDPLSELVPWSKKIHGVCILNNLRGTGLPGDIYWLRNEILQNIGGDLTRHVWCTTRWGGGYYQGAVESPYHHSHENHLKKISEYKFCIALESSYHSFWSAGFVTERILNCFRAGTVPVYMGAWDIEKYVPSDLFIDFRRFWPTLESSRDYGAFTKFLMEFPQSQYEDMVGRAYEWVKTSRIGSIPDLENVLNEVSR